MMEALFRVVGMAQVNSMAELHISDLSSAAEAQKPHYRERIRWLQATKPTRAWLAPFCWSLLGMAFISWASLRLELNVPTGCLLYLITVVVAAASGGFWSGTLTSIVAATCIDFFLLPPLFHFNIDDPMDWVALGAFEFTALVITLLLERAQLKAAEAEAARDGSERLFNAARGILVLDNAGKLRSRIAPLIREEFRLRGVVLFDAPTGDVFESGDSAPNTAQGARDVCSQNSDAFDSATQTRFCALRAGARPVGGLALCGTTMPGVAAQAIASLCAISFERARALEKEAHAEAARQAEELRSAVIEALAHEIKTPLCVIQAASSGLPALGELSDTQAEMVTSIDEQSTKLNNLVSRLLGAADLETAQIEPKLAPALLSQSVKAAISRMADPSQRERFQVLVENEEVAALVDGKLMVIVFEQLVDNAVKYSLPRSPIYFKVTHEPGAVRVCVHNQGGVIAPADRDRIFERFYRAADVRRGHSGTGLGLSIAKRIVEAHHGRIGVESGSEGTTFSVVLPRPTGGGNVACND